MEDNKDVTEIVTPPEGGKAVEANKPEGDDKDKNFAELRKKLAETQRERDEALAKLADGGDRSLDKEDKEDKGKKPVEAILFERDQKDAVRDWNKTNKVSSEVWEKVKAKVSLTGTETKGEILDKIEEAYQALPEVRAAREKKIADEARNKALSEITDDDMDLGTGGADLSGGEGVMPRFNAQERRMLDMAGVSAEERKKIDKNADPNAWTEGPNPTRKFFARGG